MQALSRANRSCVASWVDDRALIEATIRHRGNSSRRFPCDREDAPTATSRSTVAAYGGAVESADPPLGGNVGAPVWSVSPRSCYALAFAKPTTERGVLAGRHSFDSAARSMERRRYCVHRALRRRQLTPAEVLTQLRGEYVKRGQNLPRLCVCQFHFPHSHLLNHTGVTGRALELVVRASSPACRATLGAMATGPLVVRTSDRGPSNR